MGVGARARQAMEAVEAQCPAVWSAWEAQTIEDARESWRDHERYGRWVRVYEQVDVSAAHYMEFSQWAVRASNAEALTEDLKRKDSTTYGFRILDGFVSVRVDDVKACQVVHNALVSLEQCPLLDEDRYGQLIHDERVSNIDNDLAEFENALLDEGVPQSVLDEYAQANMEWLTELVLSSPVWNELDSDTTWVDPSDVAPGIAERLRTDAGGVEPTKAIARQCRCCGCELVGKLWALCDGCEDDGDCDPDESWHCDTGACDGTACEDHEPAIIDTVADVERVLKARGDKDDVIIQHVENLSGMVAVYQVCTKVSYRVFRIDASQPDRLRRAILSVSGSAEAAYFFLAGYAEAFRREVKERS